MLQRDFLYTPHSVYIRMVYLSQLMEPQTCEGGPSLLSTDSNVNLF